MEEFNRLRGYPKTFKLIDLCPGNYDLISLRKIKSKYGDSVIVKLDVEDEEKEYYLANKHGKLSDESINKINKGRYIFMYSGMIDDKYEYELGKV